nr:esterase A [uncultured bacterium]
MEIISEDKSFGGRQLVIKHASEVTQCDMTFALFLPPGEGPFPVLWYLSGLTCTHANVMDKGEYRRIAAELGVAVVCPDTSPRGEGVAGGDPEDWQLGQGAGFYVNATEAPYAANFQMYSYVTDELPRLVFSKFPLDEARQGITGHSMGGHGALICALKQPGKYLSCSAFAPITQPTTADWSRRAFAAYLGGDERIWQEWDAVALIQQGARVNDILVDQGDADSFLQEGLRPWLLEEACKESGIALTLRMQPGYSHSYLFVSTFMEDHIRWAAERLRR